MSTTGRQRRATGPGEGKRARILQFVQEFGQGKATPPSLREIGAELGLSVSTVSYHLGLLERDGSLRRGAGRPRTLTGPGRPASRASDDDAVVPLIGQIAAGVLIDAAEAAEDTFTLPRRLVGRGTLFMLRVKGDSMTGAAIADGDLVVIRQQPAAENGEVIAAQLDRSGTAEATVKMLRRAGGHTWLLPRNPAYQPIRADDAVILGKWWPS